MRERYNLWGFIILFGSALSFYYFTLAPTVLWGDDAYFQRIAYLGTTALRPDGGGHWLWLQVAQFFTKLPWENVAFRVNLLSAVAAAATVAGLFLALRVSGISHLGSIAAAISLAVAHTFWSHAVRAEVYTLFTALMVLQLLLWFSWQRHLFVPAVIAIGLFGLGLLAHQMNILLLPMILLLLWLRRSWLNPYRLTGLLLAFVIGMAPFFLIIHLQIGTPTDNNILDALLLYFTHSGDDYSSAIFSFSAQSLPYDLAMWAAFLGLQFVGIAGLLGLYGAWEQLMSKTTDFWLAIFLLYAITALFAFSYRVTDQFVFYLPSYIAFTWFIGAGWDAAAKRLFWRRSVSLVALLFIVLTPIVTYNVTANFLDERQMNPLGIRELPGRSPNQFFIWPSKRGYTGAADYAQRALGSLPAESALIAEHTPYQSLQYLQTVAQVRPDVQLVQISPGGNVAHALRRVAEKRVFLADNNPDYYYLDDLPPEWQLVPIGPIYLLKLP